MDSQWGRGSRRVLDARGGDGRRMRFARRAIALLCAALVAAAAIPVVASVADKSRGERGHRPHGFGKSDYPRIPNALLEAPPAATKPSSSETRRRSRSAYRRSSRRQSLRLLRKRFPHVARLSGPPGPNLPAGARIDGYLGDYATRITLPKSLRSQVVLSPLPVRTRDEHGRKRRVSLALERVDGDYEPINPLVDSSLPQVLGDGIAVGDDGVRLVPSSEDAQDATATTSGDQVFYPETATDSDTLATPTPTGVELFTQLRSADAPESESFEFDLPPGAELRATADRGAEVVRDGKRLTRVMAPAAADSDGVPVPVRYSVSGGRLTVTTDHRDGSYAYPILVDPLIEDWGSQSAWQNSWFYNPNLDQIGWFFGDSPAGAFFPTRFGFFFPRSYGDTGYGLYIAVQPDAYMPAGSYGEWLWRAPGETTFIPRADFGFMYRDTQADAKNQSVVIDGIYSDRTGGFVGYHRFPGRLMGQHDTVRPGDNVRGADPRAGNTALFSLAFPADHKRKTWTIAYLGGAGIYLDDPEAPTITNVERVPESGWINPNSSHARVTARDPGLGVAKLRMTTQTASGASQTTETDYGCGSRFYECQPEASIDVGYGGLDLPDGTSTVSVEAEDPLGHRSAPEAWQVKLDRANPTLGLSGEWFERRNQWVDGESDLPLHIDAGDGDAGHPSSGIKSLDVWVDGQRVLHDDQGCDTGNCSLERDYTFRPGDHPGSSHWVSVVAIDQAGNVTSEFWETRVDGGDPLLFSSGTLKENEGNWLDGATTYTLTAEAIDGFPWQLDSGVKSIEMQVDGERVDYVEQPCAFANCPLTHEFGFRPNDYGDGVHTVRLIATDHAGRTAAETIQAKVDANAPLLTVSGELRNAEGTALTARSYGLTVNALDDGGSGVKTLEITVNGQRREFVEEPCDAGGCPLFQDFLLETWEFDAGQAVIEVVATDVRGNASRASWAVTVPPGTPDDGGAPSAPPASDTSATPFSDQTSFLYAGRDRIQQGVGTGAITDVRASVVRGRVMTRDGQPLSGATVSVIGHPEYGQTQSRADGEVYMAVNGGGSLALRFSKDGYLPAERIVDPDWGDYTFFDAVALVEPDSRKTEVDLGPLSPTQIARANPVTDDDGTRQATLVFPAGTEAEMILPNGSSQPLGTLGVRATEFTVGDNGPEAMPAPLPPYSAYTYAVEYSVDEALAAGAEHVEFSRPIVSYTENFLGFPVGDPVPNGTFDHHKHAWVAEESGRVIKILSEDNGLARVDVAGNGQAANSSELSALSITDGELRRLAETYEPGAELWRVRVAHFSHRDMNSGASPPTGAESPPKLGGLQTPPAINPCPIIGSRVGCETQTLGEEVRLAGLRQKLHYSSDRTVGRKSASTIEIPLSDSSPPAVLKRIHLAIEIAGRRIVKSFAPAPNLAYTFTWDGRDAFGRVLLGAEPVTVEVDYLYDGVYRRTPEFGAPGEAATDVPARTEVTLDEQAKTTLRGSEGMDGRSQGLGGWTLSDHHFYDAVGKTLYRGDGTSRTAGDTSFAVEHVAGKGWTFIAPTGDGGKATEAGMHDPEDIAFGPDGSMYIADFHNDRVRKVDPDGIITTFAGVGTVNSADAFSGDGGPATQAELNGPDAVAVAPDGSVYIADRLNDRVRRVDTNGIIDTVAGTGSSQTTGDGGPATSAALSGPTEVAVAADGTLYIAAGPIRRVTPDGVISTFAGGGSRADDGIAPSESFVLRSQGLALGPDGTVYFTDRDTACVRHVTSDGRVRVAAGKCLDGGVDSGDGGPATDARLGSPHSLAVDRDGTLYIVTNGGGRIRRVGNDGVITTFAGSGSLQGPSRGDGGPATQAVTQATGIAIAPDGDLYFGNWDSNTVRRVRPVLPGFTGDAVAIPSADGSELYQFNRAGRHIRTRSTLTGATLRRFFYDGAGRLIRMVDGDGNVLSVERAADGSPLALVAPSGQRTRLSLDPNGHLSTIENPAGERWELTASDDGLLREFEDPRHHASSFEYDSLGRLIADLDAAGGSTSLTRSSSGGAYEVAVETGLGRRRVHRAERMPDEATKRTITHPTGTFSQSVVSGDGREVRTATDGTVSTTLSTGDPRFGMGAPVTAALTTRTPSGLTREVSISRQAVLNDPNDLLTPSSTTELVTRNGRTRRTVFDAALRRFTTTSAVGRRVLRDIDSQGRIVRAEVPGFDPATYSYDSRGRLVQAQQGASTTTFGYDTRGQIASTQDSIGRVTRFEYDLAGRLAKKVLPDEQVVEYRYDGSGNLASVTPPGRGAHSFETTPIDLPAGYDPPTVGSLATPTRLRWNEDRQLTELDPPGGGDVQFEYDDAGRRRSVRQTRGVTRYEYDSATGKRSAVIAPGAERLDFGWDGPLLTRQASTGTVNGAITWEYDTDHRIAVERIAGSPAIGYRYDADSLLTGVGDLSLTQSPTTGFLTHTSLGGAATSFTYDRFGDLEDSSTIVGGSALFAEEVRRDGVGRIVQRTLHRGAAATTYAYAYDARGRLESVLRDGQAQSTYRYDANGNRIEVSRPGVLPTTAAYDEQDRLTRYGDAVYTYGDAGDLRTKTGTDGTTEYSYDELGALTTARLPNGVEVSYVIDGAGRRIAKKRNGEVVERFLYGGNAIGPAAELAADGAVRTRFVYGTRPDVPDYMTRGGRRYRLVTDQLGSPRAIVDVDSGEVAQELDYDEFGRVVRDTNPGFQPFGFAGGILDQDTGLTRFGARDYDAETGRWTSKDPLSFSAGDTNLYSYVLNDPVNLIDPLGLKAQGPKSPDDSSPFCLEPGDPNLPPLPPPDKEEEEEPCDAVILGSTGGGTEVASTQPGPLYARSSNFLDPDFDPDCLEEQHGPDLPEPPALPNPDLPPPENPVPAPTRPTVPTRPVIPRPVPLPGVL